MYHPAGIATSAAATVAVAAIASDRTLGGLCDRVTAFAPDTSTLAVEGTAQVKGAVVTVELIYTTTDPLA